MIFHLAIPAIDLEKSKLFYVELGGRVGREYSHSVILEFYYCQLVLHQAAEVIISPEMYPRHFGFIMTDYNMLHELWVRLKGSGFIFAEYFTRHADKFEEHDTFFLFDPSNNVIEFKWYKHREAIFQSAPSVEA